MTIQATTSVEIVADWSLVDALESESMGATGRKKFELKTSTQGKMDVEK
jgi:hypothetical protein